MSIPNHLVTVSALVNADGSFVVGPFGLPPRRNITVHKTPVQGTYQIIYDSVFEGAPVVTTTPAWLGLFGPNGGDGRDGAVINEITKTYATVKLGDSNGAGVWRPFTFVLTGKEAPFKKQHEDD